jgi:Fic family protein
MQQKEIYIYQKQGWPNFTWKQESLLDLLSAVRNKQGRIMGRMEGFGFTDQSKAMLENLTTDIVKTSSIEGEILNANEVRSSIAKRLGIAINESVPAGRNVEGIVEIIVDACNQFDKPLTKERLCNWHAALFPLGKSGMHNITAGNWRKDDKGPVQVVSGAMGKEKIHYEAPASELVENEMNRFIFWFNNEQTIDPVLKAGVAHFWFITIHPFDDGNGRIARVLADMQLARSDNSTLRFYSMSAQIREQRKGYYDMLEKSQQGTMDITAWIKWFLQCLLDALHATDDVLAIVMQKAKFWQQHKGSKLNTRQHKMLYKLWDGFEGKLNTSKWAKINNCSADTALRDIQTLIQMNILIKEEAGGRSTNYVLSKQ